MIKKESVAFKADFLHFLSETEMIYIPKGILWVEEGKVKMIGAEEKIAPLLPEKITLKDYSGKLILPGFIDGHVHAVQNQVIASYGKSLLEWLEKYTFPLEEKFENPDFAKSSIQFFLKQLLLNGTTTAAIFPSRHPEATAILFEEALKLNMRIIAGKTSMDRNAPKALCDETSLTYQENNNLREKYDKQARLTYALTPRFAITSTEAQLDAIAKLKKEHISMPVQTHVSENIEEVISTKKLFPWAKSYLDIYDSYGFLGKGSLMAHGIYLEEEEWKRLAETQTSLVHCPTSNLFLGSGLFNIQKCRDFNIPLALGSDVGGGISYSMLKTAAEAYKIARLQKLEFTARNAFYLLTLGGARALNQDKYIGNFEVGKEADLIVLKPFATPLLKERLKNVQNIDELLFVIMMLGDERNIHSVYLEGKEVKY